VDETVARSIAKLYASKFIARPGVKARQLSNGEWRPDDTPFGMADLLAHLRGEVSLGHYMVNEQNEVKLFAFDIDLQKANKEKDILWPIPANYDEEAGDWTEFGRGDPRYVWDHVSQMPVWIHDFFVYQMIGCAKVLVRSIQDTLGIPCAVTYSGHKGVHVYGFTGLCPAEEAREAASIVMDATQQFDAWRGNNFFVGRQMEYDKNIVGWPQLSVEIFPKQSVVSAGGYGNLMRLPLGRNLLKSPHNPHEAKFVDIRYTQGKWGMQERNPVEALTTENQWAGAV
jgi:hypothetical protein